MSKKMTLALALLGCLLAGCASNKPAGEKSAADNSPPPPKWDAQLPGYHVKGQIGTVHFPAIPHGASGGSGVSGTSGGPDKLIVAITTGTGLSPNLEFVEIISPDLIVDSRLAPGMDEELHDPRAWKPQTVTARASQGTYLKLSVVGQEVFVELTPEMIEHVKNGFTIKWIDWYR